MTRLQKGKTTTSQPQLMMCLSVLSDDLSIDEASDLTKNLLLEEPWALARFWSEFNISQIRSPPTHCAVNCTPLYDVLSIASYKYQHHIAQVDMAAILFTPDLPRWKLSIALHCILILVQHHPVANTQCNLNIEHFDPGATHCWDQMLHTLDCRSNSNHITCCKFGSTDQRETQRGTWGVNGTDVRLVRSKTR